MHRLDVLVSWRLWAMQEGRLDHSSKQEVRGTEEGLMDPT